MPTLHLFSQDAYVVEEGIDRLNYIDTYMLGARHLRRTLEPPRFLSIAINPPTGNSPLYRANFFSHRNLPIKAKWRRFRFDSERAVTATWPP